MQRETPLSEDDLAFIKDAPSDPLELTRALIGRKQPRWLMGWRRNARTTDERTWISNAFPRSGVGDSLFLMHLNVAIDYVPAITAYSASLIGDYVVRQKVGGTNLSFYYISQLVAPTIQQFSREDLDFITSRVLELTYTSHLMRPWAEDLGYTGNPFAFDPDRRAVLRAGLDAFFARKYGLSRDELRYILDPADIKGDGYPSETFRGLKRNEIDRYGEYRTQRLVLAAFDRLTGA